MQETSPSMTLGRMNPWHATTKAQGGNGNINVVVYAQHGTVVGVYRFHALNWLPGVSSHGSMSDTPLGKWRPERDQMYAFEFTKTPPLMVEALLRHKINGTKVDSLVSALRVDFEDDAIAQLLADFQISHDTLTTDVSEDRDDVITEDVGEDKANVIVEDVSEDKDKTITSLTTRICELEESMEFTTRISLGKDQSMVAAIESLVLKVSELEKANESLHKRLKTLEDYSARAAALQHDGPCHRLHRRHFPDYDKKDYPW